MDLLAGGVDQNVVGHHQRGERIGLVLPGLPRHRRVLKLGEVPGHAGGTDFQRLQQRRRLGPSRHRRPGLSLSGTRR